MAVISEANAELTNTERTNVRVNIFGEYNMELKQLNNRHNPRVTIRIRKGTYYSRCPELESANNSTIVSKF